MSCTPPVRGVEPATFHRAGPTGPKKFPTVTAGIVCTLVVGCAIYGGLRANLNGENFRIGESLYNGQGFANAMGKGTGPTAWAAPVYPTIFLGLLWVGEGDRDIVMTSVAVLQVCVLVGTCILVLALAWQTTRHVGAWVAAAVFCGGLAYHFFYWFRLAHDCWLMLLAFDLLIAGACWLDPLGSRQRAAGWGAFGGFLSMINPSIGLAWAAVSLLLAWRRGLWSGFGVALLAIFLALTPWTVRNLLVFGRLIPVKSNLAYELYQTHLLQQEGGLYVAPTHKLHPSAAGGRERKAYTDLGEAAYIDNRRTQFLDYLAANPIDFLDRLAHRFLGTTVWYVPFNRADEESSPWSFWLRRLTFPLPFLALVFLLFTSFREPLSLPHWTVIVVYLSYLLPFIAVSYYERYTVPLVIVKALLVVWAADRLGGTLRTQATLR